MGVREWRECGECECSESEEGVREWVLGGRRWEVRGVPAVLSSGLLIGSWQWACHHADALCLHAVQLAPVSCARRRCPLLSASKKPACTACPPVLPACLYRRKYQHVYVYNPEYQSGGMVSAPPTPRLRTLPLRSHPHTVFPRHAGLGRCMCGRALFHLLHCPPGPSPPCPPCRPGCACLTSACGAWSSSTSSWSPSWG